MSKLADSGQTLPMEDLVLWRRKIRDVEFAVRSASTSRPNPLVADSCLLAAVWSPGAVCARDLVTGHPIWRRSLGRFVYDSVCASEGVVYAHSFRALHALDSLTGQSLWTWRPADVDGESLHAGPSVGHGRVFIGDGVGRFWCLDARSGEPIWSQEPCPEAPAPITATGVLLGDLMVGATASGVAVAYAAGTGKEAWRQQLDGPGTGELFRFRRHVALRTFWSVYLLDPRDGRVGERWHWRTRHVRQLACTRDTLVVATQKIAGNMGMTPAAALFASAGGSHQQMIVGIRSEGAPFTLPASSSLVGLRWSPETGMVYESRLDGIGIIDPRSGERLFTLTSASRERGRGIVDVRDGVIYVLSAAGFLAALRHPELSRTRRARANL